MFWYGEQNGLSENYQPVSTYDVVQKPFWTNSFKADFTKSSWEFLAILNFKQYHSLKSMGFFRNTVYID